MVKAAVLITAAPGRVDDVAKAIGGLGVKEVLAVTGRVDVVIFLEGTRGRVAGKIRRLFRVEGVETTETLWEVEG